MEVPDGREMKVRQQSFKLPADVKKGNRADLNGAVGCLKAHSIGFSQSDFVQLTLGWDKVLLSTGSYTAVPKYT